MEGDSRPSQELTWGDHTSSFLATRTDSVELEISSNPLKLERGVWGRRKMFVWGSRSSLCTSVLQMRNIKVQRSEVGLLKVRQLSVSAGSGGL